MWIFNFMSYQTNSTYNSDDQCFLIPMPKTLPLCATTQQASPYEDVTSDVVVFHFDDSNSLLNYNGIMVLAKIRNECLRVYHFYCL